MIYTWASHIIHEGEPLIPIVSVHGTGDNGEMMRSQQEDILRRMITCNAIFIWPTLQIPYHFLIPDLDRQLLSVLEELGKQLPLTDRICLSGFSGGAQFCHRFAYRHPQQIRVCAALSAGSYTLPNGELIGMMVDENWFAEPPWNTKAIAESARRPAEPGIDGIRFLLGCGKADCLRLESAHAFHNALTEAGARCSFLSYQAEHTPPDDATLFRRVNELLVGDQDDLVQGHVVAR